jgi:hypothetical protein
LIQVFKGFGIEAGEDISPEEVLVPSASRPIEVAAGPETVPEPSQSPRQEISINSPLPALKDLLPSPLIPSQSGENVSLAAPTHTPDLPSTIDHDILLQHAEEKNRSRREIWGGTFGNESLSAHEIWILTMPDVFFNDAIINCFGAFLTYNSLDPNWVLILSTHFYAKLIEKSYSVEALNSWVRRTPLLEYRCIVIPLHHKSMVHWSIGVIDMENERFIHYDSLTSGSIARSNAFKKVSQPVLAYISH